MVEKEEGMSKQTACCEQCRDCKWHVRIKRLAWGSPHRCMYEKLDACADVVRKHGGMCPWHEKEDNDD